MSFKISIAQLNLKVGDLKGNSEQIIAHAQQAYANGASWVLTPSYLFLPTPPKIWY